MTVSLRWLTVIVAITVLSATAHAEHPGISRAQGAIDDNKFPEARDHLRAALRSGELAPEDLARVHLLSGMVELVLDGDSDPSFRAAVALDFEIKLPSGSAPRFASALQKARAYISKSGKLRVSVDADENGVLVTIKNDPIGIVKSVVGRRPGERDVSADAAAEVKLAVDGGTIILRDTWGNSVRELEAPKLDRTTKPDPDPAITTDVRVDWYRRPWVWGLATLGFAAGGTIAAVSASSAKDDLDTIIANSGDHTFDEAEAARTRWRTRAYITDGLFVTAGAFAVVTLVAFVVQPGATAVVTPTNGGATVSWALSW